MTRGRIRPLKTAASPPQEPTSKQLSPFAHLLLHQILHQIQSQIMHPIQHQIQTELHQIPNGLSSICFATSKQRRKGASISHQGTLTCWECTYPAPHHFRQPNLDTCKLKVRPSFPEARACCSPSKPNVSTGMLVCASSAKSTRQCQHPENETPRYIRGRSGAEQRRLLKSKDQVE